LSKLMMSKKTKRLYGRMQHGIEEKKDAIRALESKRRDQEEKEEAAAASTTTTTPAGKKGAKAATPATKGGKAKK
jgi:hypothetical protein